MKLLFYVIVCTIDTIYYHRLLYWSKIKFNMTFHCCTHRNITLYFYAQILGDQQKFMVILVGHRLYQYSGLSKFFWGEVLKTIPMYVRYIIFIFIKTSRYLYNTRYIFIYQLLGALILWTPSPTVNPPLAIGTQNDLNVCSYIVGVYFGEQ